ncbi:MAG: hypothetical protein K5639_03615 [Eubacterium sp.]|nr:hypothetical protein [Eubacterium sp.]
MANAHAILSQAEIDALVSQLSKATEQSYNEGFQAASEAIAEDNDYTTGYNQGVKIGYERGISDTWNIIKRLIAQSNEELDALMRQNNLDINR